MAGIQTQERLHQTIGNVMYSTTCGFCGRLSHMEVVAQHRIDLEERLPDGVIHEAAGVFRCANCTRYNVGTAQRPKDSPLRASHTGVEPFAERPGSVANDEIVWTPKFIEGSTFDDVPPQIANAATEVVNCLSSGYLRAAALLARSVIEATAKDQGATERMLDMKIDRLFADGLIQKHVQDGAHEVRFFGNEVAHGDFVDSDDPIDRVEVEFAVTVMRELLDDIYGSPARVAQHRNRRSARSSEQQP